MLRARLAVAGALALSVSVGAAQEIPNEPIPDEKVGPAVARLTEEIGKTFPAPPVRITPEAKAAAAFKADRITVMLVPDQAFGAKTVTDAAEKTGTPVGWLVLQGVAPVQAGKVVPLNRLPVIKPEGSERSATVLFLALRREGEARLLDLFGVDAKPLMSLPLEKKGPTEKARPLEGLFTNLDRQARQVDLQLTIAASYETSLRVGAAAQ